MSRNLIADIIASGLPVFLTISFLFPPSFFGRNTDKEMCLNSVYW